MPFKDPERQRCYQRDWRRAHRAGAGSPGKVTLPDPIRVQTARDVLEMLSEQVNLVRSDLSLGTLERARTLGGLASVSLKAVATADFEARLAEVEDVLKTRPKQ